MRLFKLIKIISVTVTVQKVVVDELAQSQNYNLKLLFLKKKEDNII